MASIALTFLSLFLGFFFVFSGSIKLTPAVNEELHKELKANFKTFRTVFPFQGLTGWKPKTSQYRKAVGGIEVVCGLLLAFVPGFLKQVSNLILTAVMVGAIYTHWALGQTVSKMAPALIFFFMLVCRYVVYLQVRSRERAMTSVTESKQTEDDKKEQ